MNRIFITTILLFSNLIFFSCGNTPTQKEAAPSEESHSHSENENTVSLTSEQAKTIGIDYGMVEQKELTNTIKANGILKVPNQNKALITPLYGGVIKALYIEPGSFVKRGQVVAIINNPTLYEMQQQLQQLNIEIGMSEKEVARQQELVEGNAAPLKKLQQSRTELESLKTKRDGLQKQLSGMGTSEKFSSELLIKAPITGTISKVNAQIGSNVDLSNPIAEIVNNSQLHLDLFIYERDFSKLKLNQTIHFTITNSPGKEFDATIFSLGSAFETGSKTIPIHARIEGDKTGLIDGMNITALISLDKSTLPAVPSSAIVSEGTNEFIFAVIDESSSGNENKRESQGQNLITFRRIPVVKGTSDVGYSQITPLEEIPSGAKIVTKGAFFLLAKMTNTGEHED